MSAKDCIRSRRASARSLSVWGLNIGFVGTARDYAEASTGDNNRGHLARPTRAPNRVVVAIRRSSSKENETLLGLGLRLRATEPVERNVDISRSPGVPML